MKNLIALVCMTGYARHIECNLVFHSYLKETKNSNYQFLTDVVSVHIA